MKIVDSFSGRVVKLGDWIPRPGLPPVMLAAVIDHGLFDVEALLTPRSSSPPIHVACVVRLLHPKFLFQRVAFIPS